MKRYEDRDLWNNMKCTNIHIIVVPEGERERTLENVLRENIQKLSPKEKGDTQVQEALSPIQDKPKEEHTERH